MTLPNNVIVFKGITKVLQI